MKFLTVIPARYASSRFPGKPLALLGGKPMVQWVYERAKAACDDVVVATDDVRIVKAVEAFGGIAVMTSDKHPSGTDRCLEAAKLYAASSDTEFDVVINVQGDEPFITKGQIDQLKTLFANDDVQIGTLVSSFAPNIEEIEDPNNVKVTFSKHGKALYFSRAVIPYLRDFDRKDWTDHSTFYHHLGMYAYRFDVLKDITLLPVSKLEAVECLEQLRWLENGYNIYVDITSTRSVGIDTPQDLIIAEALLK